MTDKEKQELGALKDKCIDKRSGKPKKTANTKDLERLQALLKMQESEQNTKESPPDPPAEKKKEEKLQPLSDDEKAELENLESRAAKGRHLTMPSAVEMHRLGELRKRAKVTK